MDCKSCKTSFCWVCLGMCENGKWKCGNWNTYCGVIAQVQKITNKLEVKNNN